MSIERLVFIDVETTGLDPARHEITEITALWVAHPSLEVDASRSLLGARVRVENIDRADPHALALQRYPEGGYPDARPLADVLLELGPILDGATPAGHNVGFDLAFVREAYARMAIAPPAMDYHTIDTVSIAYLLGLPSCSLADACEQLGIRHARPHTSLDDAVASLQLLEHATVTVRRGWRPRGGGG